MTAYRSDQAGSFQPPLTANRAGEDIVAHFEFLVSTALADEDIVGLAILPAQHIMTDVLVDVPDLDTNGTPTIDTEFGLFQDVDALTAVDSDAYIANSTAGQAAALKRMDVVAGLAIASSNSNQVFGMRVETVPATGATAVTIRGWIKYRPVGSGD